MPLRRHGSSASSAQQPTGASWWMILLLRPSSSPARRRRTTISRSPPSPRASMCCAKSRLGLGLAQSRAMVQAAEASGCINMVGFNYIRTPASQLARQIIARGEIGDITFLRAEHTEDFLADPRCPVTGALKARQWQHGRSCAPHHQCRTGTGRADHLAGGGYRNGTPRPAAAWP